MKNFRKALVTLPLLSLAILMANGQKAYLDSVSVNIRDKVLANLTIYDNSSLRGEITADLKSLQALIRENKPIPGDGAFTIDYEPGKTMTIKPGVAVERITVQNGRQSSLLFIDRCNVHTGKYFLQIQFNDPASLTDAVLVDDIGKVLNDIAMHETRFSSVKSYSFRGDTLVHDSHLDKITRNDGLGLKAGTGANLLKNQPVIDLTAEVGLYFSRKGIYKNQYYLSFNQLYDFSSNSKINHNSFLSLGYRCNLSGIVRKPNWLGFEIGYLVSRQGEFFGNNTFRLGFNWEFGKYMSVSPQLYLSGQQFYPAVRIGFGF
jgi:hypothetical protein